VGVKSAGIPLIDCDHGDSDQTTHRAARPIVLRAARRRRHRPRPLRWWSCMMRTHTMKRAEMEGNLSHHGCGSGHDADATAGQHLPHSGFGALPRRVPSINSLAMHCLASRIHSLAVTSQQLLLLCLQRGDGGLEGGLVAVGHAPHHHLRQSG
jgi:hypothetical protein